MGSIAETFLSAEIVALVDTSASMNARDSRGGRSRYAVACDELAQVQRDHPGKVGVVSFSDEAVFCPGGVPTFLYGGTNLAGALEFARVADGCVRFVVISDGYPDNPARALQIAGSLTSEIDTIYVGPETEEDGRHFLIDLARRKRGRALVAEKGTLLGDRVSQLLLTSGTR